MQRRTPQAAPRPQQRRRPTWPPPSPAGASEGESLARRQPWQPPVWKRLTAVCAVLVLWALSGAHSPAVADAFDEVGTGSLMLVGPGNSALDAPRLHTDVRMQVSGIIARVDVRQQFSNGTDQWVEGLYAFPLPQDAAVDRLRMEIGGRIIVGEIHEKVEAQQLYEQAKANGQHAGVVHQHRPNLFRTAVANIAPHETVTICISYLQIVSQETGRYGLRFPLTITPRYTPGAVTEGGERTAAVSTADDAAERADLHPALMQPDVSAQSVSFDIDIDAGVPVEQVASSWHPIVVTHEGERAHVRLQDAAVVPDHDFALSWRPVVHGEPAAAIFTEHTDAGEHVLLMFMPPQERTPVAAPREAIFIIDTSGSMAGTSIEQAQAALLKGLDTLTPADRFNVLQFNSTFEYLFPAPVPANTASLALARRYVNSLSANGGTEMLPALMAALDMPASQQHLRQVLFITDGAVSDEEALFRLIRERLGEGRLFTVGIGSAPNGYFMSKAAQMGRGTFTYIGSTAEVDEKMSALFYKITHPILTDIAVRWPGNAQPLYAPAKIGDLYAGEPLVVSARIAGDVKGTLTLTGRSGAAWTRELSLASAQSRAGVATLWARNRIADLMDSRADGASDLAIREQVLPLALQYQLVSKYTSLVAVESTPVRPVGAPQRSHRLGNTRPDGLDWTATAYPKTATPAELQMLIGAVLLMLSLLMVRRSRSRVR